MLVAVQKVSFLGDCFWLIRIEALINKVIIFTVLRSSALLLYILCNILTVSTLWWPSSDRNMPLNWLHLKKERLYEDVKCNLCLPRHAVNFRSSADTVEASKGLLMATIVGQINRFFILTLLHWVWLTLLVKVIRFRLLLLSTWLLFFFGLSLVRYSRD
jgi:hypothetical protein